MKKQGSYGVVTGCCVAAVGAMIIAAPAVGDKWVILIFGAVLSGLISVMGVLGDEP